MSDLRPIKREPLPPGWHRFECDFKLDDGRLWTFEICAQSFEDAETRLRCIKENAVVGGRIVGEYEA